MWSLDHLNLALVDNEKLLYGIPLTLQDPVTLTEVRSLLDQKLKNTLKTLRAAVKLFGPEYIVISFNGGKDAVVVLHLFRLALAEYYHQNNVLECDRSPPHAVFFRSQSEFVEVEKFINKTACDYGIALRIYEGRYEENISVCLEHIRQEASRHDSLSSTITSQSRTKLFPRPIAVILGVRSSDPTITLQQIFEPSSEWLESTFIRVNPILDWTYGDVWNFLLGMKFPYCSLYDQGYTSIGTIQNTEPNLELLQDDGTFKPAYMLNNWIKERHGRPSQETQASTDSPKETDISSPFPNGLKNQTKEAQILVETCRTQGPYIFTRENCCTAGIIIIGDEVLKAQINEMNIKYALEAMREIGLPVLRVTIIRDKENEIRKELLLQLKECDVVITAGGVGPTHDDITMKSIARALEQSIVRNEEMIEFLKRLFKKEVLTEGELRLADLPEHVYLRWVKEEIERWPLFQVGRIFILPGVPHFFGRKVRLLSQHYLPKRTVYSQARSFPVEERAIVSTLDEIIAAYPDISFGSYPLFSDSGSSVSTTITVEGANEKLVNSAAIRVGALLAPLSTDGEKQKENN